jgi:hypothetical protein
MQFFKFRSRNKSTAATNLPISRPIVQQPDDLLPETKNSRPRAYTLDHENRRPPPKPLKLRGGSNYVAIDAPSPLKPLPPSPLPLLPPILTTYEFDDPPSSGNASNSDNELGGFAREGGFRRLRTTDEETAQVLSSSPADNSRRTSAEEDTLTELVPISSSPPKLRLSFESNITEAGSIYDEDAVLNHRVSLKTSYANKRANAPVRTLSPERTITSPPSATAPEPRQVRTKTSSTSSNLRRSSAIYKRRTSIEVSETSASIKSGKSTIDSPEDRDSGFHEDFDEAMRSKQSSPDKPLTREVDSHGRIRTEGPGRVSFAVTPERAPLISSEERRTPITLVDHGVVGKPKPLPLSLPEIGKMETFKETFSTNLFENTLSTNTKPAAPLLSPKPVLAKGKVVTPAEFEKLRQQAEEDSDEEEEEEDLTHNESYQLNLAKQRHRQQAALSIYRQQMTKVVGATPPVTPPIRPLSQIGEIPEQDEADDIPLGILMAHGFPHATSRSTSRSNTPNVVLEPKSAPSPGNLPVFAKNLPLDPHRLGIPRSQSTYDLRPATKGSVPVQGMGVRSNSTPSVPLLETYQTRQRKGAMFLDPNMAVETPGMETGYFGDGPYEMMGMQGVTNPGMIQYVPMMIAPPALAPMQPTLMQNLQMRQQARMSTMNPSAQYQQQAPQPQFQQQYPQFQPQQFTPPYAALPQRPYSAAYAPRPQSVYSPQARHTIYDQQSLYSINSQQPTARPKLPTQNPAYRLSTMSTSAGRYRGSTYGVPTPQPVVPSTSRPATEEEDSGWEALRRKKQEMQARRVSRMPATA